MAKSPLHILHLEDDLNDAELVRFTLEAEGIASEITCLQDRDEFVTALEKGDIDLVISDSALRAFDGLSAIAVVRARWPDLPVILVSGKAGEELAVDSLKGGATDYILKEHLSRLPRAVRRVMQEVEERAERRRLESHFIEAQKMEVIGQLVSGVAHDFNNMLAVIIGYSDLVTSDLVLESPLRRYIEEIRHASERATGLTRQLLVFGRKQAVVPIVLDINDVVNEMEKMVRRLIDANIEMQTLLGKRLGHIKADSGHVGQVLMNLVVNARDAMPNGGKLTITTANVKLDQNYAHEHKDVTPGDYVMLGVSDTGSGMTDEVKGLLFEAFFTTKPLGKGTGLGLATCQIIVHQSGGHIAVYSELGRGATFKVYFPRVVQPLDVTARPVRTGPLPLPCGTEKLLFVEDDPSVRHLACRVLENLGYKVLSASNGKDALHLARGQKRSPIRLVITDVILPLMDGKVMAERLKARYPNLKILFTSGYTDGAVFAHGVLEPGVEFLPKPYTPAALARKVRHLLDEKSPSEPAGPED